MYFKHPPFVMQSPFVMIGRGPVGQSNQDNSQTEVISVNHSSEHFARHGGVHFRSNRSPEEINDFVRHLPESKRDSLFEVLHELVDAGYITLYNDELWADGEGKLGGSEDC